MTSARFASSAALCAAVACGCALPGEIALAGLPTCAEASDELFSLEHGGVERGPITAVDLARNEMVIDFERDSGPARAATLRFDIDAAALAPALGATLRVTEANCFGEGCQEDHFTVDDALEVGAVAWLDDDPESARPLESRTRVVLPADGATRCREHDAAREDASARVATDNGEIDVRDGESLDISIGGEAWRVIGGPMHRHTFHAASNSADGPFVGWHSITRVTTVLYRTAEDVR